MLTKISSTDNTKIKLIRKLKSHKGRSEEGLFVAEGINLVSELIKDGCDIDFVVVAEDFDASRGERNALVHDYITSPDAFAVSLNRSAFDKLTDAKHGAEAMAVAVIKYVSAKDIDVISEGSCILVCDRIQDPGNMGTMIRTAAATGYGAIALMPGCVDVYSPKVLRSTAGMITKVPIIKLSDTAELTKISQDTGRRIIACTPEGGRAYYEEQLDSNVLLVIGNEAGGVASDIMDIADSRVTLPMNGDIESLNAAVAASILMYEAVRCKHHKD